jgi:transcriptional regulator with XRE-family HTH domain
MSYLQIGLGKNISRYRNQLGLTQDRFSELLEISVKHLSDIERGKVFPSANLLLRIAGAVKVKMEDLFCFDQFEEVRIEEFKHVYPELNAHQEIIFQLENIVKQKCNELKSSLVELLESALKK